MSHTPEHVFTDTGNIRSAFANLRAKGLNHRDAARAMGLSEGAAVAAHMGAPAGKLQAHRIRPDWMDLLQSLENCGPLLACTRNEHAIHEKTGVYKNISGSAHMGIALGEAIDLRLFFSHWHAGFSLTEPGAQPSLQFFDASGKAIHKIFACSAADLDAWQTVIKQFVDTETPPAAFIAPTPAFAPHPDSAIDAAALLSGWQAMQDTHDFFGLLKTHRVTREQALRLAQGRFASQLASQAIHALLQIAAAEATPIMCFVSNDGCTQIHTGPISQVKSLDICGSRWLSVLDPDFALRLREDAITRIWAVDKPTKDGVVTSVEAFDADGGLIAMFYGERRLGNPELQEWRALVANLPRL